MIQVKEFFDQSTWTLTYIVWDPKTLDAVIIDPVLDYDPNASKITYESLQKLVDFVRKNDLRPHLVLETHAHADHISSSQFLKREFPGVLIAIGERIREVQGTFKEIYNLPDNFSVDGSQFDRLLRDGEEVNVGSLKFKVFFTPGHTPACSSYLFENKLFVGDALFMPDYGTGRCDFPAGSSEDLYHSVHEVIYRLPEDTMIYTGHDYQPNQRPLKFAATIKEQKQSNIQLSNETTKHEFVKFRKERDKTLDAPRLLLPSIQINIAAGHLPEPEGNGRRYLKIPLVVPK